MSESETPMSHAVTEPPHHIQAHRRYDALRQSREALNLIFLSDCDRPPLAHEPISVI
jgi:hypothetical protein